MAIGKARSRAKTPLDMNASRVHRDYRLLELSADRSEMVAVTPFSSAGTPPPIDLSERTVIL
jgi:hypothetical protein